MQRLLAVEDDPAAALENLRLRQPMGRLGQPDEVAKAALYLASDAADFITGIELVLGRRPHCTIVCCLLQSQILKSERPFSALLVFAGFL